MPHIHLRAALRFTLAGILSATAIATLHAVPAAPEASEVKQPDGTTVRLVRRGDEFFSWDETEAGYATVKNQRDGYWEYARPVADRAEFRAVKGARVGTKDPLKLGLKRRARPTVGSLKEKIRTQRLQLRSGTTDAASSAVSRVSPSAVEPETPAEEATTPPQRIPVSGTKTVRNVVILACFADHWDSANSTVLAAHGRTATAEYAALFNTTNYSADGAVGSVRDYYREVSYGKLTVDSLITAWVKLPNNEAYYGDNDDARASAMVTDAIAAADAAGFDFSQGDSDGDGWVDCLTIIHSGHGEEYGGAPASYIWSHQGETSALATADSVSMKRYHTEPALRGLAGNTGIARIGVICHELGHFFGLPDLYDYSGTSDGLGDWSLMAGGSWNGSLGNTPAHFDAWSKCFLGFVTPTVLHTRADVALASVEDHPEIGLLRDGTANGEYFLVENRARVGFDNTSAIHPGLLIYHVASASENNDLGTWDHPAVKIEEADGNNSLGAQTASSEPGDVWTSTNGLAGGFRDETGNDNTNALLYQPGSQYARSSASATRTWLRLSDFSAASTTATFEVATLRTAVPEQTETDRDFILAWPACSTSSYYELQEGEPVTLTAFADSAEDDETAFENWVLSGTAARSSGGARTGSYSYALIPGSSVQAITLRQPFTYQAGTTISYYLLSKLVANCGTLRCQVSNDDGLTWTTLRTDNGGYIGTWSQRTITAAQLATAGLIVGDSCRLRFVANFERVYGYSGFPQYGFALDDITIAGTAIASHGNWTTLSSANFATSFAITGKASGLYAYRVRNFANGAWQPYGPAAEVVVAGTAYSDWTVAHALPSAAAAMAANPSGDGIENLLKFAFNLNPSSVDTRTLTPGTGTAGLPTIGTTTVGGTTYLTVELLRRKDAAQLTYHVEASSDLASWSALAGTETVTAIDTLWERVLVVDTVPASRRFARVRVGWSASPAQ
ncbi:MAG TPA: M6 family metalloprotease domain-containing protein [Opitutaceae bacterium]|nr:M6 family metalloprotease domain-containing protein [Opitutaceae bacterium]